MAVTARKYNPGFLSVDELVAIFCVRTAEYESLMEALRECSGGANTHQIVIGPRGSGKTSLLLRVAAEVLRDAELSARFFPIVFAEESYEVSTAGEFWLECVSRLADQAPRREGDVDLHRTFEDLRTIHDDRTLEDRCLGVLQDFADREEKRLVLIVENLNMMFTDMGDDDAGWRLRKALQTEPRIVLLASATSRFDQMNDPKEALYELFRVVRLHPLDTEDCATLWQTVSGQARAPQTIQALRILTGGSPRLLTIVARFGANLSFRELMADLLDLVDDHTEYFKSHLDALPAQERKVYLALADLWKPANAREIAERARLGTSKCSAQLARLVDQRRGGSERRQRAAQALLPDRAALQHLLPDAPGARTGAAHRRADPLHGGVLLHRRAEGVRRPHGAGGAGVRRRCVGDLPDGLRASYRVALPRSASGGTAFACVACPWVCAQRVFRGIPGAVGRAGALGESAGARGKRSVAGCRGGLGRGRPAVRGKRGKPADREQVSLALVNKGKALGGLGKSGRSTRQCGTTWCGVSGRTTGKVPLWRWRRRSPSKGGMLSNLNRHREALAAWQEVARRFRGSQVPTFETLVANALVGKAVALNRLNRPREALEACDEVLERFGESGSPGLHGELAAAMVGRGHALIALNRVDEAISAWSAVVERFGRSDSLRIVEQVASALANVGTALFQSGRLEEALTRVRRCRAELQGKRCADPSGSDSALFRQQRQRAGCAEAGNGSALVVGRSDQGLRGGRFAGGGRTVLQRADEQGCGAAQRGKVRGSVTAVGRRGGTLRGPTTGPGSLPWSRMPRRAGAPCWNSRTDTKRRSPSGSRSKTGSGTATRRSGSRWSQAPSSKGAANLFKLNRTEEALAICDRAVDRFGDSVVPAVIDAVAGILINKGIVLVTAQRNEEALAVWDEIERRFGNSDEPEILKQVASALVSKGTTLAPYEPGGGRGRGMDDIVRRFGEGDASLYHEEIASALLNSVVVLGLLNRPDEALEACDEALRRFGNSDEPYGVEAVAQTLVNKGSLLVSSGPD